MLRIFKHQNFRVLFEASRIAIAKSSAVLSIGASAIIASSCAPQIHGVASNIFKMGSNISKSIANDHMVFVVAPPDTANHTAIGPTIQVEFLNQAGQVDISVNSSVSLAIGTNPSAGLLSGTATATAVNGVAIFSGLSIDQIGTGYTLLASSANVSSATSAPFNIIYGAPTQLVFVTQPAGALANASLGSVAVRVEDAYGNGVGNSVAPINLAIGTNAGPGGILSGSVTVNAVGGIATLPGLSIDVAGTGYTLIASSVSLTSTTSAAFNISATAATKLSFTTQPSNAASGASLGSIAVTIEDGSGNPVAGATSAVTLAIGNNAGPGGILSGTLTVNAINGVATFPGLGIDVAGTGYTLTAASGLLTGATSNTFNITVGAASKLAFTTQPSNAQSGASLGSIKVTVEDSGGNKVTSSTASVTLAIGTNAGPSGTLSGTVTLNAVAGVATLPGLSIDKVGVGYTLTAASGGLTGATSSAFNISAGPATQLIITGEPTNTVSAATINSGTGVIVTAEDANGNVATGSSASIALAVTAGPGSLSGTTTVSASAGVATFSNLSIAQIANGYALTATSAGLTSAVSSSFNITVGPPSQLVFTMQPADAVAGVGIVGVVPGNFIAIAIEDAGGNVITASSAAVTISIGSGPGTLHGTLAVNAVSGVATFSGNWIDLMGAHTLSASSAGGINGTSASFNISPAAPTVLAFSGGTAIWMNKCSDQYTLTTQDIYTNVSPVTSVTTFSLGSTGSTTFYTGNTCSSSTTTASFGIGVSSIHITMIDAAQENFTATASLAGWSPQSIGVASQTIVAITSSTLVQAGVCNLYNTQNQDGLGSPVNVSADLTVNISQYSDGSVGYYSDAGCTIPTGSFVILSGTHTGSYYYKNNVAENETTVLTGNLLFTSWQGSTVSAGPIQRTAIEGPSIITPNVCSSAFKATALDAVYNQTNVTGPTTVTLSTTGSTQFYSDAGCSTGLPSNQLTIATSTDSTLFYVKTAATENVLLTATVAGNLSNGQFGLHANSSGHTMAVSVGGWSTCAMVDGFVKCWGSNYSGQLGNGTNTDSLTPVTVSGLTGVTQIANSGQTFCALNGSGLWCWGFGINGEFGNGVFNQNSNVPVQIPGFDGTETKLVGTSGSWGGGNDGFCVIKANGDLYCWTDINMGEPGIATLMSLPGPVIDVSAQGYSGHVCAVISNGTIYCWGSNGSGQLGDGTTTTTLTPVKVAGINSGATAVAALESATCAIVNGGLSCWGSGYQLTAQDQGFPGTAAQINATHLAVMVIRSDGSMWYQGDVGVPWQGYSGDGTSAGYDAPSFGQSLITSGALSVSINTDGGCAVVAGAGGQPGIQCWNIDRTQIFGMLGDGSIGQTLSPFWTFSLN